MLKTDLIILKNKKLEMVRDIFAPYTTRVYLVGGCVRDAFLGVKSTDFDIEIYDILPEKFDELMAKIGASGVGKSYFIYKFLDFDIGLPRTESKTGKKHTDFSVAYCNDEKTASKRRDFSCNSIMINIFTGEILDFWGGQKSIKDKILRHINDEKFKEDALRMLRGVQFASRFGFNIDEATLNLMKSLSLNELSKDRISAELLKFFRAEHLDIGTFYLYKLRLLNNFFGLTLDKNKLENFIQELKNARIFIKDERLFLYLLCGNFGLNLYEIILNLSLPKSFLSIKNEPFFKDEPSDFELLKIATKIPLNLWLGLNTSDRVKRAKKLGFFNKKFDITIDTKAILEQGFKNKEIGREIERQKELEIAKFLKLKSLK